MVTIDYKKCIKCGVCIARFEAYCISSEKKIPKIDYSLCNQCQKCISVCPIQAILMNNIIPERITEPVNIDADELIKLMGRRRSVKKFKKTKVPNTLLGKIAEAAKYAPNQNKNIEISVVNSDELLSEIDKAALKFVRLIYKLLFSAKPLIWLIGLFSNAAAVTKKKMEYDLFYNKHIIKENTSALFLLVGNPHTPTTQSSAQYLAAFMMIYSEALGIGSCLMDSLKLSLNANKNIRKKLGIKKHEKVLSVLSVGYSNENIINQPQGYEIETHWNGSNSHDDGTVKKA